MHPFEPELYLRLLGERMLVGVSGDQRRGFNSEVAETARALVRVGVISLDDAQAVTDDYLLAAGLRNGRGPMRFARGPAPTGSPPEPRRTVSCNVTIKRPGWEIRVGTVTLSASETRLSVTIRALGDQHRRQRDRRLPPMRSTFSYTVTDDRGASATTVFSGGSGEREARGRLTTQTALSMETAWIELEGTRIELVDKPSNCVTTVEALPDRDARAYLWHTLASLPQHGPGISLDLVIEALVKAGRLDPDDPQLPVMIEVSGSLRGRRFHALGGGFAGDLDAAPPEWRSLLSPRHGRNASGEVSLNFVAPAFDGISVAADQLSAHDQGWSLDVDVSPGIQHGPFNTPLDEPRVAWWAVDDLGQHYLGALGSFSGGPDGVNGTVEFTPGIDRAATRLTLLPTGSNERVRIEFPLDWSAE